MLREILKYKAYFGTAVVIAAMFVGCGKEDSQVVQPNGNATGGTGFTTGGTGLGGNTGGSVGTGTGGTSTGGSSACSTTFPLPPPYNHGDNAQFYPVSSSVFAQFAKARPWLGTPNCPGPINANLDFSPYGGTPKVYLGFFTLQYYDAPYGSQKLVQGYMDNGYPVWNVDKGNYIHQIYTINGQQVVRIMVEDRFGAVTLIITPGKGGSDSDIGKWTATVYFYNFPKPTAPNPRYDPVCTPVTGGGCVWIPPNPKNYCWSTLLTDGPYRCKNLTIPPAGDGKYPFTVLGTIKNIDLNEALGI